MRITPTMTERNFLSDLRGVTERMSTAQRQVASGQRLFKPSDDPLATARSMSLRAESGKISTWVRSIEDTQGLLNATDSALGHLTDSLTRAKDLVMQARNQTLNQDQRNMLATELTLGVRDGIVGSANAQYNGRYIFAGTAHNAAPFTATGPTAAALAAGAVVRTVGDNETATVSINAGSLNTPGGATPGMITSLNSAIAAVQANNDTAMDAALGELDAHMNNILNLRAQMGSVGSRLERLASRHEEVRTGLEQRRVEIEDTDYAEAIGMLTRNEVAYGASLYVGARLGRQSLVDFLR